MDDTTEQYLLQISAQDNASATVNQVNAALTQTLAQTQQLNLANTQASTSYSTLAEAAAQLGLTQDQLVAMVGDTSQLTNANQQLAQSYDQVAQSAASAASAEADSGGGDDGGGFSLGGARSALRAGGGLLGANAGGGALRAAGQIATLTSVLGPVGIVAGVAAEALRGAAEAEQKRAEAAKEYISAVGNAAGETSSQIQNQINQQQVQLNAYHAAQDGLQKLADQADDLSRRANLFPGQEGALNQDQYLAALDQLDKQVSVSTGGIVKDTAGLTDALSEGQTQIDKTQGSVNFLGLALGSVDTAAANAAAAATHHGKLVLEEAQASLQADQLTSEQRQKKSDEIQREIDSDQALIDAGQLTGQQTSDLTDKMRDLRAEQRGYADVVDSTADALARAQALTDANTKTEDLLAQEGAARDQISATEADIAQIRSDAADQAAADLTDEQAKIADIQEQGAEKQQEIAQNNADAIARIQRQFALDDQTAIGNRDAYADDQARKKEQLDLTNQQATESKQLTAEAAAEQKSIAQAQSAYEKSLAQQEQAEAKELASKDLTLQREQDDLQNILAGELALSQEYGVGIVSSVEYTWQQIESAFEQHGNTVAGLAYATGQAIGIVWNDLFPSSSAASSAYPQAPLPPVSGTAAGQQHVVINVQGVGYTLGEVVNGTLGLVDVLLRGNN